MSLRDCRPYTVKTSDVDIVRHEDGGLQFIYPYRAAVPGVSSVVSLSASHSTAGRIIASDVRAVVSDLAGDMDGREVFMSIDVSFELNERVFGMIATVEEKLDRAQDH